MLYNMTYFMLYNITSDDKCYITHDMLYNITHVKCYIT